MFSSTSSVTSSVTFAGLVVMGWGLGRPAFWLDEAASVSATQRSWPQLWILEHGPDAPLVPYYVVLKVLTAASSRLVPPLASHPELLYRWPSAVAMALAIGLLAGWVRCYGSARFAVAASFMMLLTAGISRYGQEVRPYAFAVLLAVLATRLWTLVVRDQQHDQQRDQQRHHQRSWRWALAGYALVIAALVTLQTLAAGLVAAHLVAAWLIERREIRWRAVSWTGIGAAAGLLIAAPQVWPAIQNGGGARGYPPLSAVHLVAAFADLFTAGHRPILRAVPLLALAAIGMVRSRWTSDQFLLRTAAAWALVPPVVLALAVVVQPNLLIGRYVLFAVPAWSVFAGLGAVTILDLVANLVTWRPASWALPAVLTAGLIVLCAGPLRYVRGPAGHGEDIRPAIALTNLPQFAQLPIVMAPGLNATELEAYDPSADRRVIDINEQHTLPVVWPTSLPRHERQQALDGTPGFILLDRRTNDELCVSAGEQTSSPRVRACTGLTWLNQTYQVAVARQTGHDWSFMVLMAQGRD